MKPSLVLPLMPACHAFTPPTTYTGQGTPPVRIREVCESLNSSDGTGDTIRCCLESVCGSDLTAAMNRLSGMLSQAVSP